MSLDNQTTLGDYAPQPQRRRVSRGRKALIGLMAIGAFAAVGGAGTFASFTASTDNAGSDPNDNAFETPTVVLTNTILQRNGDADPETECFSSEDRPANTADGLDGHTDNAALCDFLFEASDTYDFTADLRLENNSSVNGSLTLWAINPADGTSETPITDACEVDATPGVVNLCDDWMITIQEYAYQGNRGTGIEATEGALTFDHGDAAPVASTCLVPFSNAGLCSSTTGTLFQALKTFNEGGYTAQGGDLLAYDNTTNEDTRFYRLRAWLPTDCADAGPSPDGIDDVTGLGCHNEYQGGSAKIMLRWVLQPTA